MSGEYCGKLLSDFGAEVIKLEKPGCGSPTRSLGPFAAGRRRRRLRKEQVVVIDDHPPGWLKSVGIDPKTFEDQYPQLVLGSITP